VTGERYVLSTYFSRYVSAWMPPAPAIVPDAVSARGSDDERERHALGASNSDDESQTSKARERFKARRLQGQTVWKNPYTVLKPDFLKT
jgi:hypothetical protein